MHQHVTEDRALSKKSTPSAADEGVVAPRDAANERVMGFGTVLDQSKDGKRGEEVSTCRLYVTMQNPLLPNSLAGGV